MKKIIEEFNTRIMMEVYADRDTFSRGKIIDLAKEILTEVVKNNSPLPNVVVAKRTLCETCNEFKKETITFCKECYLKDCEP